MNGYYRESLSISEADKKADPDVTIPAEIVDPLAYEIPADAELIDDTPIFGTEVAAEPVIEPLTNEVPIPMYVPMYVPMNEPIAEVDTMDKMITPATPVSTNSGLPTALLEQEDSEHFRTRWNEIQATFVDDPRTAVQQADALVSEVIDQITQMFATEHSSLEGQWNQGSEVSTEDLRKSLQHYRSFFNRLVV